ncbi:MAG: glycosyltransferase family 2 protein [Verrucomicrobia bacterium]|nr:glycosyltransferase family 2 protein [Verrucomicrobiota bacterium]
MTEPGYQKSVSIVAPVFNEAGVLQDYAERLDAVMQPLRERYTFEVILVDDGSRDDSLNIMRQLSNTHHWLRVIELRRNYGQTAAMQAGLDAAGGDIIITMDSDLQHFPEDIPKFLEYIAEGCDVVCGWRRDRQEGVNRRWPSKIANALIRRIAGLAIHDFGTTFRAYRAEIAHELRLYGEFHRFIPALAQDIGARVGEIPIQNVARPVGRSNYGIGRTFGVSLDLIVLYFITRYMDRPMRAFGKLAVAAAGPGMVILAWLLGYAWLHDVHAVQEHSGWFMVAFMLILAAVQILMTGILAEILVRIHFAQGDRRVYKIRQTWSHADHQRVV